MDNRAKEFLFEALDYMKYGKYAQAEIAVRHAITEVWELEQMAGQAVTVLPDQPTIRVLPGRQTRGLVVAELSKVQRPLSHHEKRL